VTERAERPARLAARQPIGHKLQIGANARPPAPLCGRPHPQVTRAFARWQSAGDVRDHCWMQSAVGPIVHQRPVSQSGWHSLSTDRPCRIWRASVRPGSGRRSRHIRSWQQRAPRHGDDLHASFAPRRIVGRHQATLAKDITLCDGEGRENARRAACAPRHRQRSLAVAAANLAALCGVPCGVPCGAARLRGPA
jgi:hypothetical protein